MQYRLNQSQKNIMMNDIAFPKDAINTISVNLHFPEQSAMEVADAVNCVIRSNGVFSLCLSKGEADDGYVLEDGENRELCSLQESSSYEKVLEKCHQLEKSRLPEGRLYDARVWMLEEGGSYLQFRFHHVIVDGYSMCQIAQMILDRLEKKTVQPEDGEQKAYTGDMPEEVDAVAERAFWLDYFKELKIENSIFQSQFTSCEGTCYYYDLSREFSKEIEEYAKRHDLTPSAVFSGAFSLYLSRAMQTEDAVFIMPRLNRDTEELRSRVGCYTMVVPVRVTMKEDRLFSEHCREALSQSRIAAKHKNYGIKNIISDLKQESVISELLSEYTYNYYQPVLDSNLSYDIRLTMDGGLHNHLTMNVVGLQGYFRIGYDGRNEIYDEERVRCFHEGIMEILREGMKEEKTVGELEIVGESEKKRLLSQMGQETEYSDEATIPSLFREVVKAYPDRPALYAGGAAYTFSELDRVSNRIANALMERGIKQSQPVLYMLHRNETLIPTMLGILKAGAAFIPIDPEYPEERIRYILENSQAACLISSYDVEIAKSLEYIEVRDLLACEDEHDPMLQIPQTQLAYCIYTSGTTGKPKGVMLSHRGIANITRPDNNPFNKDVVATGTGLVAIGSVCFDISLFEFFVPLLNGKFIEFAPEDSLVDPVKLARLIMAHGANLLHCTPSRLSAYIQVKDFTNALEHVEAILAAGEVLPGSLVDELRDQYGIRIYNGYGPTETTIGATITEAGDNLTIGRPIANTGVYLLDAKGRLLPYGAAGEICVYGRGVGIGYLGLEEMTKEKFVDRYGKRTYRTGDWGRFLPDGRITYHGRRDQQVKLRGLRIELSEIENCILEFPGTHSTCVQVRTVSGTQHLAAFYTVKEGSEVDEEALKTFLKGRLTLYMVPDIMKRLDEMPTTPSGKLDQRALNQIELTYVRQFRKPENKIQEAICDAFAKVLQMEACGLDDNFFELGGDSLHIAEVISEIEERLSSFEEVEKVTLEFADLFRFPTPDLIEKLLYHPETAKDQQEAMEIDNLDYSGISELLSGNVIHEYDVSKKHLGNVLLIGVTGFLGIHILTELLKHPEICDTIYCLARSKDDSSAEERVSSMLFYYAECDLNEYLGSKIEVLEGDIVEEGIFTEPFDGKIQTVINSAASVAHFAYDDKLRKINIGGTENLLKFCKKQDAMMVHISTISVGGVYPKDEPVHGFHENDFYEGQQIHNEYIYTKYMSEYVTFRAAIDEGIRFKMIRIGNLQGRLSDGEFQVNGKFNAFSRSISSYVKMGFVPESLYQSEVNFSPVDEVARMIVALVQTTEELNVFHVYPPEDIPYKQLFEALRLIGRDTEIVSEEEFSKRVDELGKSKRGKKILEGILLEKPNVEYKDAVVYNEYTVDLLGKMGYTWNRVTDDYLNQYFSILDMFQMYDEEEADV